MAKLKWQELVLSRGDPDLTWELFHENSKTNPYVYPPSDEEVLAVMSMRWESSSGIPGFCIRNRKKSSRARRQQFQRQAMQREWSFVKSNVAKRRSSGLPAVRTHAPLWSPSALSFASVLLWSLRRTFSPP